MATKAAENLEAALFSDNPEYQAMFDVNQQGINAGSEEGKDYTDDMDALLERGAVQEGTMRSHLGLSGGSFEMKGAERVFTFYSYRANEIGWRENTLFSSEGYQKMSVFQMIGPTIGIPRIPAMAPDVKNSPSICRLAILRSFSFRLPAFSA